MLGCCITAAIFAHAAAADDHGRSHRRRLLLHGLAAIKVLREGNRDARRRFADEARLLANLRDPHLVRVLAVGETTDGAPHMALEYLELSARDHLDSNTAHR